ncbi:MAG: hypothetical protein GTO18_06900 [Anaerolineales bacterium]|nr:hypothetical protein [Anaerolineales bacterium]
MRLTWGLILIPIGLFVLGGLEGRIIGILVATFAFMPILSAATGFYWIYAPFGFFTLSKRERSLRESK